MEFREETVFCVRGVDGLSNGLAVEPEGSAEGPCFNHLHKPAASTSSGGDNLTFRRSDVLNASRNDGQLVINSSDSILKAEEVKERGVAEDGNGLGFFTQVASHENHNLFGEFTSMPTQMNMYRRRKKGQVSGSVKELQSPKSGEKACLVEEMGQISGNVKELQSPKSGEKACLVEEMGQISGNGKELQSPKGGGKACLVEELGHISGNVKESQSPKGSEKACLVDEPKTSAVSLHSGAQAEIQKQENSVVSFHMAASLDIHIHKTNVILPQIGASQETLRQEHSQTGNEIEKITISAEEKKQADTLFGGGHKGRPRKASQMLKDSVPFFRKQEGLKQQKHAKAKNAFSAEKKRARHAQEQCFSGHYRAIVDEFLKTDHASKSGNIVSIIENGKCAAINAGLRASTTTSIEKVWFKDTICHAGGLQKYLECRNFLLGLWEKDVSCTLSISDCGLSEAVSIDDTHGVHLLRDIHFFLAYRGFINMGVTSKRPRLNSDIETRIKDSSLHKRGISTAEKFLPDRLLTMEAILNSRANRDIVTSGDPSSSLYGREHLGSQELITPIHEQKKRSKVGTSMHGPDGAVMARLGLEFNHSGLEMQVQSVSLGHVTGVELPVMRPSGEEFLLDIKNRIKAKNKRKKQGLDETCIALQTISPWEEEEVGIVESVKKESISVRQCNDKLLSCNLKIKKAGLQNHLCKKRVVVIGAGPAGLVAARHLQNMGVQVTILEARNRVGGRAFTDCTTFSGPVDLGASTLMGVEADLLTEARPDPVTLFCKQLNLELSVLQGDCPLLDVAKGVKVPDDMDMTTEGDFHCLLEEAATLLNGGKINAAQINAAQISVQKGLKLAYKRKEASVNIEHKTNQTGQRKGFGPLFSKGSSDFSLAQRILSWHFAAIEIQCGAELSKISLSNWAQENNYGGFSGPYGMIKGGFSSVMESLGNGLAVHFGQEVTQIEYSCNDHKHDGAGKIQIQTRAGAMYCADAALVTVPLGCLKAGLIKFSPPLPENKVSSIERLGLGLLNRLVMEFPVCFWDESVDSFGCVTELTGTRGRFSLFTNLKRIVGFPILSTEIVGEAALEDEQKEIPEVVEHALLLLRRLFGDTVVPQPIAFTVTRWGSDPYSRGSFSYVAVGASGEDFDTIALPVENQVFFAGEATCKEYPNTVGGAILTGLREAVRILDVLDNRSALLLEIERMSALEKQGTIEANEVTEITKILTEAGLSVAAKIGNLSRAKASLKRSGLLQSLYAVPKTTTGRLLLAKEMLQLPDSSLRNLLNTNASLMIFNSWIQGAIGKDGEQLLWLCLQLLLVFEGSYSAVQRSSILTTIKDKVSKHRRRGIRAMARKLLALWFESKTKSKSGQSLTKPLQKPENSDRKFDTKKTRDFKVFSSPGRVEQKGNSSLWAKDNLQGVLNSKATAVSEKKTKPLGPSKPSIKKKGRNLKPLLAGTGAESRVNLSIARGNAMPSIRKQQIQATSLVTAEVTVAVTIKEDLPEPRNRGQGLESMLPTLEASVSDPKVTVVSAKPQDCVTPAIVKQPELPKIMSFQKFAKREQHIETVKRRPLQRDTLLLYGRDLVTTGADARHSKVRDWSIDFSDSCSYLGSPRLLTMLDNASSRDCLSAVIPSMPGMSSTENAGERHESGLTSNQDDALLPNSKEVSEDLSAGSSMRGSPRRQSGVCLASLNSGNTPLNTAPSNEEEKPVEILFNQNHSLEARKLEASTSNYPFADGNRRDSQSHSTEKRHDSAEGHCASLNEANAASAGSSVKLAGGHRIEIQNIEEGPPGDLLQCGRNSCLSNGGLSKPSLFENQNDADKSEQVRKVVTDYIAHLLTPLYKTKRISKESFKSIMKKAIAKVIERRTEEELLMDPPEFMDTKRKIKIRSLIDKMVERYLESVHKY